MERGGVSHFYQMDGLGSVTEMTGSTGTVAQSYAYDSFGQIASQSGSLTNPYTYTGREFDNESGLYYYRARYYDVRIGRFIQEDPISLRGGNINFYVYVGNSPIILKDPLGLMQCSGGSNCKPCNDCPGGIWGGVSVLGALGGGFVSGVYYVRCLSSGKKCLILSECWGFGGIGGSLNGEGIGIKNAHCIGVLDVVRNLAHYCGVIS